MLLFLWISKLNSCYCDVLPGCKYGNRFCQKKRRNIYDHLDLAFNTCRLSAKSNAIRLATGKLGSSLHPFQMPRVKTNLGISRAPRSLCRALQWGRWREVWESGGPHSQPLVYTTSLSTSASTSWARTVLAAASQPSRTINQQLTTFCFWPKSLPSGTAWLSSPFPCRLMPLHLPWHTRMHKHR